MASRAAANTGHGRGTHLSIFLGLRSSTRPIKRSSFTRAFNIYLLQYYRRQFRRSARSLPGNCLHFPHFQKCHIKLWLPLRAAPVLVNWSIEDWPWSATTRLFTGRSVYSNSLCAPSLDFLTNTCGPGAEGEVLSFVAVLWKGSDSVCWQQRQVFNVAAVSLVDFH